MAKKYKFTKARRRALKKAWAKNRKRGRRKKRR